jgi:hypothetical protein
VMSARSQVAIASAIALPTNFTSRFIMPSILPRSRGDQWPRARFLVPAP